MTQFKSLSAVLAAKKFQPQAPKPVQPIKSVANDQPVSLDRAAHKPHVVEPEIIVTKSSNNLRDFGREPITITDIEYEEVKPKWRQPSVSVVAQLPKPSHPVAAINDGPNFNAHLRSLFDPKFALKLLSSHKLSGVMQLPALVQPQPEDAIVDLPILKLNQQEGTGLLENVKTADDIELDPSQKKALLGLKEQQFACLIGAAGTGKTTVTKKLVKMLEDNIPTIDLNYTRPEIDTEAAEPDYNIAIGFCAFTGRAVQQMKRALPIEYHPMCNTIHRTLGYMPEWVEYISEGGIMKQKPIFKPTFTKYRKLPYKVLVIDEGSMVPIKLWNELFDAITEDCRVIMIGDINQLPPVQGRSVFGFAMTKWPVFELTEIWRQKIKNADGTFTTAEANPIVENAWAVLQGRFPKKYPKQFDMLPLPSGSIQTFNTIVTTIVKLHQAGQFDPLKDALIVPQNISNIGQQALNERLVAYFNPPKKINGVVINPRTAIITGMGSVVYGLGDKVMLLQNDRERALTNGMTGVITDVTHNGLYQGYKQFSKSQMTHVGEINFADLETAISAEEKRQLNLTKAQVKEEEEAAQRQASHIVTVRFGVRDPAKDVRVTELREEFKKYDDYVHEFRFKDKSDTTWDDRKYNFATRRAKEIKIVIDDLEEEIATDAQEVKFSTAGDFKKLTHAYAITCHKAQGGEYPTVVIVCHSANLRMLTREWLYTAITRAKSRIILLSNDYGLEQALRIQRIKGTSTKEKVKSFVDLIEREGKGLQIVDIPNLPEPIRIIQEE